MKALAASFAVLLVSLSLATSAQARNEVSYFSVEDAMKSEEGKARLAGHVKFYFADQAHPAVEATVSQGVVANKKSGIGGDEAEACNRAFVAALAQLQEKAQRADGNAVINIESYFKKSSYRSKDKYECHAGHAKTVVTLKGDVVKLKE